MTYTFKLAARLARLWSAMVLFLAALAIGCLPEGGSANDPSPNDSTLIAIVVDPAVITVDPAEPASFAAYGLLLAGDSIPVTVSWSASGGTMTPGGTFVADSAGTYDIVAAFSGGSLVDSARVYVNGPPSPALASVVVTPSSASVDTGESAAFAAYGLNPAGDSIGVTVVWSASGGTVTQAGVFQAATAGNYRVIARTGGKADTAQVTVAAPPPPPPPPGGLVNECNSPGAGWIFCDDFDQDRTGSYFEYDAASGSFARTNGVGNGGSYGMKAHYAAGQVNAGYLHLAMGKTPQAYFQPVDGGTANYREIYWRFYLKNQAGWTGGGGAKLTRAFSFASPTTWAQSMFGHVWSGSGQNGDRLALDPASGTDLAGNLLTTTYNDFPNMRWLGAAASSTPIFDAAHVGNWYCIETHIRLNTAGQSDGVFELWIDGNPEASRTGLNWLGSFNAYGINAVYLENYWGAGGSPVAQERYFDNLVVSTQRIGC